MGFLKRKPKPRLAPIRGGSATIDRQSRVLASTFPAEFERETLPEVARTVTVMFQSAQSAQLSLTEVQVRYPALTFVARDLKGGAVVFIAPKTPT